jgi:hypothetical protein
MCRKSRSRKAGNWKRSAFGFASEGFHRFSDFPANNANFPVGSDGQDVGSHRVLLQGYFFGDAEKFTHWELL